MNNDLEQFSEERLIQMVKFCEPSIHGLLKHFETSDVAALARIALAAKQAKPVAITDRGEIAGLIEDGWVGNFMATSYKGVDKGDEVWLYTTPQIAHTEQRPYIYGFDPALAGSEATVITNYFTPDGWKLVPEEATIAMLTLLGMTGSFEFMQQKYKAMLAAAPKPESE